MWDIKSRRKMEQKTDTKVKRNDARERLRKGRSRIPGNSIRRECPQGKRLEIIRQMERGRPKNIWEGKSGQLKNGKKTTSIDTFKLFKDGGQFSSADLQGAVCIRWKGTRMEKRRMIEYISESELACMWMILRMQPLFLGWNQKAWKLKFKKPS